MPSAAMEENGGGQTPEDASVADELISPIGESDSTKVVALILLCVPASPSHCP